MDSEQPKKSSPTVATAVEVTISDDATEVWSSKTAVPESTRLPNFVVRMAPPRPEASIEARTEARFSPEPAPDADADA